MLEAPIRWRRQGGWQAWTAMVARERAEREAAAYALMRVHQREAGLASICEELRGVQALVWLRLWRHLACFHLVVEQGMVARAVADRRRMLLAWRLRWQATKDRRIGPVMLELTLRALIETQRTSKRQRFGKRIEPADIPASDAPSGSGRALRPGSFTWAG